MSRRKALTVAGQAVGGLAGAIIVLPAVGFAIAPIFDKPEERWESVGPTSRFTEKTYTPVVFTQVEGIGEAGKTTAYVRKAIPESAVQRDPVVRALRGDLDALCAPRLPGALRGGGRTTSSAPATAGSTTSRAR